MTAKYAERLPAIEVKHWVTDVIVITMSYIGKSVHSFSGRLYMRLALRGYKY